MQHMKTVHVPATTNEVVDRIGCDFCGATIKNRGYEFADITLQCDRGTSYPECGSGTKTIFDCCENCWDNKVLPALRALGATPRTQTWDF